MKVKFNQKHVTPHCRAQADGRVSAKKLKRHAQEQCGITVWLHGSIRAWPNGFDFIHAQAYLNLFNNTGIQIQIHTIFLCILFVCLW